MWEWLQLQVEASGSNRPRRRMMMAAARWCLIYGVVLTILTITSVSSVYVRRGSDITDCSMKCHHIRDYLPLYRVCRGAETNLLELWCNDTWSYNHWDPRLHLNISSGCWRLADARKDDSCLYVLWRHNRSGSFQRSTNITVLDPVLISNITSNSSRLGQDIAVSVQFSGEEAAVTWEVDGGSLPDRYRLLDDNRTLIIPSAQREDAGRKLRVQIRNPVSEETREFLLKITDPVLFFNITSNSSRLGQDIAVSVQFSGEEAAVTWEVDGGSLPDRYRLIDDNMTLIILSAQREDAGRKLRVRITNPVSEETREYLLEITDPQTPSLSPAAIAVLALAVALAVGIALPAGIFLYRKTRRNVPSDDVEMQMNDHPEENGHPP